MSEFEIFGSYTVLRALENDKNVQITERWSSENWNVKVSDENVDDFTDWCDENQVDYKLL